MPFEPSSRGPVWRNRTVTARTGESIRRTALVLVLAALLSVAALGLTTGVAGAADGEYPTKSDRADGADVAAVQQDETVTDLVARNGSDAANEEPVTDAGTTGATPAANDSAGATNQSPGHCGNFLGATPPSAGDSIPVLLGGFSDTDPTFSPADFERTFFGKGPNDAQGPGTLRDYWANASDGIVQLDPGPEGVTGWYEVGMDSSKVKGDNKFQLPTGGNDRFVRKVVERADEQIDFRDYDSGDGCLAVVVVYQEIQFRAHASDVQEPFFMDFDTRLEVDGVEITGYARVQEVHDSGGMETIGTPAHELGHLFGLPDLYEEGGSGGIGPWGLMGRGNHGNTPGAPDGSSPTHLTAWTFLELARHPSPRIDVHSKYRAVIDREGQAGILPPAAQFHEFYRIEPRDVSGCSTCDDQYYLLSYREQVGFDRGLQDTGKGDHLRIWQVTDDGSWKSEIKPHPDILEGVSRLDGAGTGAFNASTETLARLADGSDSGLDLREFEHEYGVATFNDPPERHLDAGEEAVFAVPVGMTLPNGTRVPQDGPIDSRVAWQGTAVMNLSLSKLRETSDVTVDHWLDGDGRGFRNVRTHESGGFPAVQGGWKLVERTNASTDYVSATTYPTFPLPSDASVAVTGPSDQFPNRGVTVTARVTVTAGGENYEYGQFGAPNASHFDVEVGGKQVPTGDISVTERAEHEYVLKIVVPGDASGYGLSVAFTDEKVGVEHTVTATDSVLAPIVDGMAGDGSQSAPYEVTSLAQLQAMVVDRDAHFELTTDIDASNAGDALGSAGFTPVASPVEGESVDTGVGFNGTLDGNGHVISGLQVDSGDGRIVGLFGVVGVDGVVENVGLESVDVNSSATAGGIAGVNWGTIRNSYVTGSVSGRASVGGLVGSNDGGFVISTGVIERSYSTATVEGDVGVGGLAGENRNGTITESFATGEVTGTEQVGGLVGWNRKGNVTKSYARGDVDGTDRVGGLVGEALELERIGLPPNGQIIETYATGRVTGENPGTTGGLVGVYSDIENVRQSYWDTEATGLERGAGEDWADFMPNAEGLTTAAMQGQAARENMVDFDFQDTWQVTGPDEYPELQWVSATDSVTPTSTPTSGGGGGGGTGDGVSGTTGDRGGGNDGGGVGGGGGQGLPGFGLVAALAGLALVTVRLLRGRDDS